MAFTLDPRLAPDAPEHKAYVDLTTSMDQYLLQACQDIYEKQNDWWDLFLAHQEDKRDPIDESWRSDAFIPAPYWVSRTKAAQFVELLGNSEPVWQVEAAREEGTFYEQSRHYENALEYIMRENRWRKTLYKWCLSRSVQGTTFIKVVHQRRAHTITLFAGQEEKERFSKAIEAAKMAGMPDPPPISEKKVFEQWRDLVNKTGRGLFIPAIPQDGPVESVEYDGPIFQQLPLWTIRVDPMIDEMQDQRFIIHRMVKPESYVTKRMDDDPNSRMPYLARNVAEAMSGWDGQVLETQQQELAERLGLQPAAERHPYYERAVELLEVWSPEEPFQHAIIMNRRAVINKRPFERPLLTSHPNLFALRNVIVPGHFYGMSDYQEPEKLFKELNTFRRLRMDGATLNTLPVFVKQSGIQLTEQFKKLRPGLILSLPQKDAIQSLIQHTLPPEAYREPAELKQEIDESTEVYSSTRGAPATIGRVTGTEYQGRSANTLLKYKVDASIIEEELAALPQVCLSFLAQMSDERLRLEIGGDPDALVDLSREQLVAGLTRRFRFRGATKHINPDLQIQQLNQAVTANRDILTVAERRFAMQLVLEMLEMRGISKVVSVEGTQQLTMAAQLQAQQQNQAAVVGSDQAAAMGVPVPGQVSAEQAGAVFGGGQSSQEPQAA